MQQQINRRLQQEKIKILPYNLAYTKRLVKVKTVEFRLSNSMIREVVINASCC